MRRRLDPLSFGPRSRWRRASGRSAAWRFRPRGCSACTCGTACCSSAPSICPMNTSECGSPGWSPLYLPVDAGLGVAAVVGKKQDQRVVQLIALAQARRPACRCSCRPRRSSRRRSPSCRRSVFFFVATANPMRESPPGAAPVASSDRSVPIRSVERSVPRASLSQPGMYLPRYLAIVSSGAMQGKCGATWARYQKNGLSSSRSLRR